MPALPTGGSLGDPGGPSGTPGPPSVTSLIQDLMICRRNSEDDFVGHDNIDGHVRSDAEAAGD